MQSATAPCLSKYRYLIHLYERPDLYDYWSISEISQSTFRDPERFAGELPPHLSKLAQSYAMRYPGNKPFNEQTSMLSHSSH